MEDRYLRHGEDSHGEARRLDRILQRDIDGAVEVEAPEGDHRYDPRPLFWVSSAPTIIFITVS